MIATGCGQLQDRATTIADHERLARHYEATARSIEVQCAKARRNELTVTGIEPCWKGEDIRFRDANRDAAAAHRAVAAQLSLDKARADQTAYR